MSRRVEQLLAAAVLSATFVVGVAGCRATVGAPRAAPAAEPALAVPPAPDSDHDGIADEDDERCPTEPEDRDGFEDADGCPDLDNDHDRILDANDKCPTDREVYNGVQDDDGCPDEPHIQARPGRSITRVTFDGGSAVVRPDETTLLDQIANGIASEPDIEQVTVVGHADPRERQAPKLAAARATAVQSYLVGRGVPAQKLLTRSAGADSPICPRRSCAGDNRRVEFEIHKTP